MNPLSNIVNAIFGLYIERKRDFLKKFKKNGLEGLIFNKLKPIFINRERK